MMSKKIFIFFNVLDFRVVFFVVFFYVVNVPINGSGRKNINYVSTRNVLCAGL